MPERQRSNRGLSVSVNGVSIQVPHGAMVSTALLQAGVPCRISVSGEPRIALCGMGICFECRAIIDGVPHLRTCQVPCREAMRVETQL